MQRSTFVLSAGAPLARNLVGRVFRLKDGVDVDVRLLLRGTVVYEATGMDGGFWAAPEGGFDSVELQSATGQTVIALYTRGNGGYDRSQGDVNATPVLGNLTETFGTLTVGTSVVFGAAAIGRRAMLFMADPSNTAPIWMGGASVTVATGLRLDPGDLFVDESGAEGIWYAISTAAGQILRRNFTRKS